MDVSDPNLVALKAMLEVREEMKEWVELQIVAFPQEGSSPTPTARHCWKRHPQAGADVIGAIPISSLPGNRVESLHYVFDLAEKYQVLVDVHCDEIDDEQSLLSRRWRPWPTSAVWAIVFRQPHHRHALLQRSLCLAAVPAAQDGGHQLRRQSAGEHSPAGRFDNYPKRRGITRVKEMLEANINVCFGHDDVFRSPGIPWARPTCCRCCIWGCMSARSWATEQINDSLKLIGSHSARTLNVQDRYGIEVGKPANLLILPAENGFDAVRRQVPVRYSIRHGRVIADTRPAETTLHLVNPEPVDFRR